MPTKAFHIFVSLLLALATLLCSADDRCDRAVASLDGRGYQVAHADVDSTVFGVPIRYVRVDGSKPVSVDSATKIKPKALKANFFAELFMKLIKPAITSKWITKRFNISNLVDSKGNEVILGLDGNHLYLMIRKAGEKNWTRADGGAFAKFFVRDNQNTIADGAFFRFTDLTDAQIKTITEAVRGDQKYYSCAEGACTALEGIGIRLGTKDHPLPKTTEDTLRRIVKEGFTQDGKPAKVELFTTSPDGIKRLFADAIRISQINTAIKEKSIEGFVYVGIYGSRTALRLIFLSNP